jgi:hypothetical protein
MTVPYIYGENTALFSVTIIYLWNTEIRTQKEDRTAFFLCLNTVDS